MHSTVPVFVDRPAFILWELSLEAQVLMDSVIATVVGIVCYLRHMSQLSVTSLSIKEAKTLCAEFGLRNYFGKFLEVCGPPSEQWKDHVEFLKCVSIVNDVLLTQLLDDESNTSCLLMTGVTALLCLMLVDRGLIFERKDAPAGYSRFSAGIHNN